MENKTTEQVVEYYETLSDEDKHNFEWFDYFTDEQRENGFAQTAWAVTRYKVTMRMYLPGIKFEDLEFYYDNNEYNQEIFFVDIKPGIREDNKLINFGNPYNKSIITKTMENNILKIVFELTEEDKMNFDLFVLKM